MLPRHTDPHGLLNREAGPRSLGHGFARLVDEMEPARA
jgi:hypothetical protein